MTMTCRNSNKRPLADSKNNPVHKLLLQKAEDSVARAVSTVADTYRLRYHFMPRAYWMNDPNGLVYYGGYYHVFYQHHPYSPDWGPMHWGHTRTKDFINWEHLPIALAPSEDYDADGCFSGSAVVDGDLLHLFYTGHRLVDGKPVQVQCRATSSDGIHFVKDTFNPLIDAFPSDGSPDFRDPKVWKHKESWFMVLGSGKNSKGNVLLYRSEDLSQWRYVGVLAESDGTQGTIWECPDIFPLGDKHVLLVSPMGTESRRAMYFVGEMDYQSGMFTPETVNKLDHGPDFYAAQTFFGAERRIMLAWMDAWEGNMPSKIDNWAGALTLPRELVLGKEGQLQMYPLQELQELRQKMVAVTDILLVEDEEPLALFDPQNAGLELNLVLDLASTTAAQFGVCFTYRKGSEQITVGFDKASKELCLDTKAVKKGHRGRFSATLRPQSTKLELRIFLDRSSIEVFADHGATTITARVYPSCHAVVPRLFAVSGQLKIANIEFWRLK